MENRFKHLNRDPNEAVLARKYSRPTAFEWDRENTVADFFGETGEEAVAMLHPQLKDIKPLVDKVLKACSRPEIAIINRLQRDWAVLVGTALAPLTRPIKLNGNCLEVSVSNSTVLYALCTPMLRAQLCRTLASVTENAVMDVKFTIAGK